MASFRNILSVWFHHAQNSDADGRKLPQCTRDDRLLYHLCQCHMGCNRRCVAGEAGTSDTTTRMYPLVFTSPLSKLTYLSARFCAALTINVVIILCFYAGVLFSFYGPGARTEFIGPFRTVSYITAFSFVALPTVIATTSIQFTCAVLTGRARRGLMPTSIFPTFPFSSQYSYSPIEHRVISSTIGTGRSDQLHLARCNAPPQL